MSDAGAYKGIILAGGLGTRLSPVTAFSGKQLLPVYDKPLLYYPLTLLLLAGLRDILIISRPEIVPIIKNVLGSGDKLGVKISYDVQVEPRGISDAFLIAEDYLANSPCFFLLGDNIINKAGMGPFFKQALTGNEGATVFGMPVPNPSAFGVLELEKESGRVLSIEEKPSKPKSDLAAIGVYLYDGSVVERAKKLTPSARGELEITDLNESYLKDRLLGCKLLSRGDFWADAGTFKSMNDCSNYIRLKQDYTGLMIGCPEEAAFRAGFISRDHLIALAREMPQNHYAHYLRSVADESWIGNGG